MIKYRLICGNKSKEANYSSNSNVVLGLDYITNRTFTVYAIDSRGNSTPVTKAISVWKDYVDPVISSASATRENGVGTETTLSFSGTFWNSSFGAVSNEIIECSYKYKKTTESNYGNAINITPTISGNNISFNSLITGDAGASGFTITNSYYILLTIKDRIRTITYTILFAAGNPAIAIHKNGVAFGVPYDNAMGGLVQFEMNKYIEDGGAINMNNSDITRANSIFMNDEATGNEGINFLKEGATTGSTNASDYECLRGYRGKLYYNDKEIPFINDSATYQLTNTPAHSLGTNDYHIERKGKMISFICNTIWMNSITANTWTIIGNYPVDIMPNNTISTPAIGVDGNGNIISYGRCDIQRSGREVRIKLNNGTSNLSGVCFSITWPIE